MAMGDVDVEARGCCCICIPTKEFPDADAERLASSSIISIKFISSSSELYMEFTLPVVVAALIFLLSGLLPRW